MKPVAILSGDGESISCGMLSHSLSLPTCTAQTIAYEFGFFGISIKDLLLKQGKQMIYSEQGLGGTLGDSTGTIAPDINYMAKYQFKGSWPLGGYTKVCAGRSSRVWDSVQGVALACGSVPLVVVVKLMVWTQFGRQPGRLHGHHCPRTSTTWPSISSRGRGLLGARCACRSSGMAKPRLPRKETRDSCLPFIIDLVPCEAEL